VLVTGSAQAVLGTEVVHDEARGHTGIGGDRPQSRGETVAPEPHDRGVADPVAGA
jgi:hypothetical protein